MHTKSELIRIFRTGERLMNTAVAATVLHGQKNQPTADFKQWCANIGNELPRIRLYFRVQFHLELEAAEKNQSKPFHNVVTGDAYTKEEAELALYAHYAAPNQQVTF